MEEFGIPINTEDSVVITDEGSSLLSAIGDLDVNKITCNMHWSTKPEVSSFFKNNNKICHDLLSNSRSANKHADCMIEIAKIEKKTAKSFPLNVPPQSIMHYPRILGQVKFLLHKFPNNLPFVKKLNEEMLTFTDQQIKQFGPSYSRLVSFCEQDMSKYKKLRLCGNVIDVVIGLSHIMQEDVRKKKAKAAEYKKALATDKIFSLSKILVPFAYQYMIKILNSKEVKQIHVKEINLDCCEFETFSHIDFVHRTNFITKQCTNCNYYAENELPCKHLLQIYKSYPIETKVLKIFDGHNVIEPMNKTELILHLCGPCYHLENQNRALDRTSNINVVSRFNLINNEDDHCIMYPGKSKKSKRYASRVDYCQTGVSSKKKSKRKSVTTRVLKNYVENEIDPDLSDSENEIEIELGQLPNEDLTSDNIEWHERYSNIAVTKHNVISNDMEMQEEEYSDFDCVEVGSFMEEDDEE